ncbi:MAG: hypothetical protein ACOCWG_05720, partial [bacterium]
MKKTILFLLVVLFINPIFSQDSVYVFSHSELVAIDGLIDDAWNDVNYQEIGKLGNTSNVDGYYWFDLVAPTNSLDLTAKFKVKYDDSGLYFLFHVIDNYVREPT